MTEERTAVAVGLIVAEDGRLLLQLRDEKPGLAGAGKWGLFGGHVEESERPQDALLREMQEELGWRPRHFELFLTREVETPDWHVTSHAFAAHLNVPVSRLVQSEGQAMDLFPPDALPATTTDGLAQLIEEFAGTRLYKRMQTAWPLITATALLVDRDGRFLLQHRDDKPSIANPGMWGSFGGEIEPYETPEDGFLREMQEELAWQPAEYELVGAYPFDDGAQRVLVYVYAALVDVPESALVLGEGQDLAFFRADSLPEKTVPALRALIERWTDSELYERIRA